MKTEKIKEFAKKEVVLCIAAILAICSMFAVHPDQEYIGYIDYNVLAILFSLMTVMAGLTQIGVFDRISRALLKRTDHFRKLSFIMVFLCFFSAMFITNDVALITFVPFTLLLLKMAELQEQAISLIVYETIAANLGSMLTPIGNPQNLYLYTASGMGIMDFLKITSPITALSAVLLGICCLRSKKLLVALKMETVQNEKMTSRQKTELFFFCIVFVLALLYVLKVKWIPVWVPFSVALIGTFLINKKVLLKVDYSLLLTFVSFFIFIGNMGRIDAVRIWLSQVMAGRELLISFFASQMISNVPAAALLSGFTDQYAALIRGTNIGGLGTLIASLASLISYKAYVREYPDKKGKYFGYFTFLNVIFAVILLVFTMVFWN